MVVCDLMDKLKPPYRGSGIDTIAKKNVARILSRLLSSTFKKLLSEVPARSIAIMILSIESQSFVTISKFYSQDLNISLSLRKK
ncbi:uncharacterized protein PHALS_00964 [Plasmopara halstedii]|uniref:Uncharacterized protein n=1 Tax=Plasmopara halstedii TaxID=4781 RepID=A0A0P1AS77_PLAHL|nr:uncharacterized protein PHALS_00964 [Plasmopara halstedii]CEG44618.1 hypothetical protein PHALS_00964 [Plasmopara halstedii]|eukprot:XP_024580987.1 hypothetical protein PHALS_00964 [Plasmopara halstedii]